MLPLKPLLSEHRKALQPLWLRITHWLNAVAASGTVASAESAVRETHYIEDMRAVLDQLALAKAKLDITAWHSPDVTAVTAAVLGRIQAFVNAETIACTGWPTPAEVVQVVRGAAHELGAA